MNSLGIPDPLTDHFALQDLRKVAPWVWEEIEAVGIDEFDNTLRQQGGSIDDALPMRTWVAALTRSHSQLWSVAG